MANSMLCLKDFEYYAREHMNKVTWTYFNLGAERENTAKDNEEAFERYRFIPRMLRNYGARDMSVTVLGNRISFPVGLAPTAYQCMAHPGGELAAAKAANRAGAVYTLATLSNTPLEDVAKTCTGEAPLWMQVYVMTSREVLKRMIQKAENHGYRALVLTVDTPVIGLQLKVMKSGFSLLPHLGLPNMEAALGTVGSSISAEDVWSVIDPTISWDIISWIRSISKLPIILKGILTGEDARLAVQHGVSAIWVSNHGGRQLDGTMASIDVLSEVVSAVDGKVEVYMDGGIRWGSDILKALALGARAVFIGRPLLWGLAHSGEEGVTRVLEILRSELDRAMTLAGCRNIEDIGRSLVRNVPTSKI